VKALHPCRHRSTADDSEDPLTENAVRFAYRHIGVRPIAGALGAEISGCDIARPPGEDEVAEIRQALLDHLVIFLPEQEVTAAELLTFSRLFGEPMEYAQVRGSSASPLITEVAKLEHEKVNFGGVWHTDTSYLECPPMASMLYAVEVPPYGGDTLFANQIMAYEALSDGIKECLDGLRGVSDSRKVEAAKTREDRQRDTGEEQKVMSAIHPVVRTHPETGRKGLYVNCGHTVRFDGWTEAESRPLLEYLYAHQTKPEFTCRHSWRQHTLAIWDNRSTQHNPVNDYQGFRRIMHRVTLAGDRPV
jgi:taurine dioxygenase